jgi:phosphatidylglycerol:prolipoprotein diacylglycerol transferase
MLVIAFLVSSWLATQQAKRQGLNQDLVFNLSFLVFISGIIGARIFYIIDNLGYYIKNPLEMLMLQHGGLSWFGGLLLGIFSAVWYLKSKHFPISKMLDLISPFASLAQAIGRIGCLLNGCCFGKVSSYGIYFPVHNAILIPTQLYSSLILIFIFMVLRLLQDRPHQDGQIFFSYLLLYSTKRFFIEFWRQDNEIVFLGLTLFQVISIAIFIFSAVKLSLIIKSKK